MSKSKDRDYVYVLRVVNKDMKSSHGFKYPRRGRCTAPDWDPYPECGNGLHGWLNGRGNIHVASIGNIDDPTHNWLVIKVARKDHVRLDGKCKFRTGYVVFCGTRENAINYLAKKGKVTADTNWQTVRIGYGDFVKFNSGGNRIYGSYNNHIISGDGSVIKTYNNCYVDSTRMSKITVGSNCNVSTRNGCDIKTGHSCNIVTYDHCKVITHNVCYIQCGYNCNIIAGNRCFIIASTWNKITADSNADVRTKDHCEIIVGDNSRVKVAGNHASIDTGLNSTVELDDLDGIDLNRIFLRLGTNSKVIYDQKIFIVGKDIPLFTWVRWNLQEHKWERCDDKYRFQIKED